MDKCTKTNILYAILGIIFGILILLILFAIIKKIDIIEEQNNKIYAILDVYSNCENN